MLSFADALQPPCLTCDTSPCCRFLPLQRFALADVMDLDYARYLLNFTGIELGVAPDGQWQVYYQQPCRFLDPATSTCTVHATPEQPHVCSQYSAYRCWYREALGGAPSASHLRVDRRRLGHIMDMVVLDQARMIVGVPSWDSLVAAFGDLPLENPAPAPLVSDGPTIAGVTPRGGTFAFGDTLVQDPCIGCPAYCCRSLIFPVDRPGDAAALDYLRFALGFPGVELIVSDHQWGLAVATTCQHLDGSRCSLYDDPGRPLRCSGYDAWSCDYRPVFEPVPGRYLRLRYEQFAALVDGFRFDAQGVVAAAPTLGEVRTNLAGSGSTAQAPADRRLLPLLGDPQQGH